MNLWFYDSMIIEELELAEDTVNMQGLFAAPMSPIVTQ